MRVEGDTPPKFPTLNILEVGGYKDGFLYAGKVYGKEIMLKRPENEEIVQAVKDMTPQHEKFVDKTYPCQGGLEHLPQAYAVAQKDKAFELANNRVNAPVNVQTVSLSN